MKAGRGMDPQEPLKRAMIEAASNPSMLLTAGSRCCNSTAPLTLRRRGPVLDGTSRSSPHLIQRQRHDGALGAAPGAKNEEVCIPLLPSRTHASEAGVG
jgi:hypothetical protein